MPIYKANGKRYDIPEDKVASFESAYPEATVDVYDGATGKGYEIPVAKVAKFKDRFPQWSYNVATEAAGQGEKPVMAGAAGSGDSPALAVTDGGADASTAVAEPPAGDKNQQEAWKPTSIDEAFGIQAKVDGFNRGVDKVKSHLVGMAEYTNSGAGMSGGQLRDAGLGVDMESGRMSRVYQTPSGEKMTDRTRAELGASAHREAVNMTVAGQLRSERRRLGELSRKRMERSQELDRAVPEKPDGIGGLFYDRAGVAAAMKDGDEDLRVIDGSIRQSRERIEKLQRLAEEQGGKDVGFWRGLTDVVGDLRTWDMGISDARDAGQRLRIDSKLRRGESLSENETALMESIADNEDTSDVDNFWHRAGVMTGEMLPFMLDFAMMGGARGGSSMMTRNIDAFLLSGLHKAAPKVARNKAVQWTTKVLGAMPEDLLVRAPLMTNTVQGGKTVTDIVDRKLGDVVVRDDGTYDFSNDKTWGSAVWQGEANAIIENYSEMFGTHLEGVLSLKTVGKLADTFGAKRLSGILTKASNSELAGIAGTMQTHLNRLGVSDYFGEVGEEYYGQFWRTMLNLDDAYKPKVDAMGMPVYKTDKDGNILKDEKGNPIEERENLFLDGQFHGDIWGGMALSMGLMGAGKYSISAAAYGSMKHRVNKTDTRASEIFTPEVWDGWRERIDGTTNDKIGEMAEAIVADPTLTDEQRTAAMNYMEASLNLRGFNLASVARQRGGEMSEDEAAANESYMDGYSASTPQEMNDAKKMLDLQRGRLASALSEDLVQDFDNDPIGALSVTHDPELRVIAADYVNAKAVYDGMIQRVRDDVDGRIAQSNAMIDSRTNRETGMIHPATMKADDRKVYIVNGSVAMFEDGTGVDTNNSSESIIIRDAETGKVEFADPSMFHSVDEAVDAETEKEAARAQIIDEIAVAAANNIDGVHSFTPGESYSVLDLDGNPEDIAILGQPTDENGIPLDGYVDIQYPDGTIQSVATSDLQQLVDAANTRRVEQFDNERQAQRAAADEAARQADQSGLTNPNRRTDLMPDDYKTPYDNRPVRATRYIESENGTGGTLYQDENGNDAVVIAAIDNNNYVGYFREYDEEGNPTNRWSAKFQNGSGLRENHRDMMLTAQELLPAGHELTEHTSVSTDGLRNLANQLKHGYELQYDEQGNIVTTEVAVNMMARDNTLGLSDYEPGSIDPARVSSEEYKEAASRLIPYMEALGLSKFNIHWEDGTMYVDHPILKRADTPQQEVQPIVTENAETVPNSAENRDLGTETVPKTENSVDNAQQTADDGFIPIDPELINSRTDENGNIIWEEPEREAVPDEEPGQSALSRVPVDENGKPQFTEVDSDTAWDGLVEKTRDEDKAQAFAQMQVKRAETALSKAEKSKSKETDDIDEFMAAEDERQAVIDRARGVLEQWRAIAGTRQRRLDAEKEAELAEERQWEEAKSRLDKRVRETSEKYRDLPEVLDMLGRTDPQSIDEVAAWVLSRYKVLWGSRRNQDTGNVVRAGVQQHTGIGEGERRRLFGLFASEANGGRSIESLAEDVFEEACSQFGVPYDNGQALDALIDVIKGASSRSDITNYIINNRIAQAESEGDAIHRYYEDAEAVDREYHERYGMSESEWVEFSSAHDNEIGLPDDEYQELMINLGGLKADEEYERGEIQEPSPDTSGESGEDGIYSEGSGVGPEGWVDYDGDASRREEERGAPRGELVQDSVDEGSGGENEITESSIESVIQTKEDNLRSRIEVKDDDWTEGGGYTPTLKRTVVIDGTHNVTQVDAPNEKGDYTGSIFEYDGKTFGDLQEVIDHIDTPQPITTGNRIAEAEAEVNTNPTDGQKKAGNYKKGHVQVGTFDVTIENPKGSKRSGTDADGKKWETTMTHTYGYIRGTKGVDGDHIDVYISSDIDGWNGRKVFVVDQYNPDGSFDEHKVMLGFNDKDEAFEAYLSNYEAGWEKGRRLDVTAVNLDDFEKWIESSKRKTKAFADYKDISKAVSASSQGSVADYKSIKSKEDNSIVGRSLSEQEASDLIARMEANAEVAPAIELTPENWIALFGEDGTVETPIGNVKMGENQYIKMAQQGRNGKLGMIKLTLQTPNVIVEDFRPASSVESERNSSYIFVKTFTKDNGERYYHFTSVTVRKDGREVVISNQERTKNRISKLLQQGTITWINDDSLHPKAQVGKSVSLNDSNIPTNSDNGDALLGINSSVNEEGLSLSSERYLTEAPGKSEGPDLVPTSDNSISEDKDNSFFSDNQESAEEKRPAVEESSDKQTESEDSGEQSPIEGKLTEFALRFKDAGSKGVPAIEREMSVWISGQRAESLVAVDANMLRRVCMAAGLDKGKAWAFRMSIDQAIPKDLLSEVWRLRNSNGRNGESDTPVFSIEDKMERNQEAYDVAKGVVEAVGIDVVEVGEAEARQMLEGNGDARKVLRTPDGTVYGWTVGGKVYLNRDAMNPETPVHEYTHLWDEMVRKENPELWNRGKELLRQTPMWDYVVNDLNYADIAIDEDAVASEVHSRLTGKDGARLLQEMIDRARKDGALATAEAVTLVERIKGWLQDMFAALRDTLGKWSKRELEALTLDDFNNMTLRDLAEGMNPRHGDRMLGGVHNISEQKLLKALRIGGLVNPSVAIINVNQGSHDSYGEISLLLPSSMIDKQRGSSGAWPGDAWTPTYPPVERRMKGEGADLPTLDIMKLPMAMQDYVRRSFNGWLDGRGNEGLAYWFLSERGEAPDVVRRKRTYTVQEASKILRAVKKKDVFGGLERKPLTELTDAERSVVKNAYIKYKYDGSEEAYNEQLTSKREIWEKLVAENKEGTFKHMRGYNNLAKLEETGLMPGVEQWLNEVQADINAGNREEPELTSLEANRILEEQGLRDEFDRWVDGLMDRYGIEEVIFDGYTPSGNRRYVKNTAENASRIMREQGKNAATGWFSSFSKFVAAVLKPMNKREDIRNEKHRLTTNHDELDAFDAKWSDVFFNLGMKCQPDATGKFDDYGMERLVEAIGKKNPIFYLESEYGVKLSSEDVMQLMSMVEAIRRERPAMYFEKKFERPVQLNEFAAAVIPQNAGKEVREALNQAGVRIVEYDSSNKGDRRRALLEASSEDVRFHAAMARGREDFEALRDRAVAERGIVMPWLNESEVRVVYVQRHDFKGDKPIAQARKWAKKNIVGEHTMIDSSGAEVIYAISGRMIDKYLSASAINKSENVGVHLSVLKELPAVIRESIEAEVHPDYKKDKYGIRSHENGLNEDNLVHRFYGAVDIAGVVYRVKTTIIENNTEDKKKPHSFEVSNVELVEETAGQDGREGTGTHHPRYSETSSETGIPDNAEIIPTAKLLQGVEKSYDPGKKLLDESKKTESPNVSDDEKNVRTTSDVYSGSSDGDVRFRIDDYTARQIESYNSEYNSVPVVVIGNMSDIESANIPEEVLEEIKEAYTNRDIAGVYCEVDQKIYIFANNESGVDLKDVLIHENLHAIVDSHGDGVNDFLDRFMNELSVSPYRNNVAGKMLELIRENYPAEDVANEYFTYMIQYSESDAGLKTAIQDSLTGETLDWLNKQILDRLYGAAKRERREKEEASRVRHEEVPGDKGVADGARESGEEEALTRSGAGAYSDAEVSMENDPWSKAWGESLRTQKEEQEFARRERGRMRDRAKSLSSVLGIDIEVIEDASSLKGKKQRAKGWYDTKTGKITVVVGNHNSAADMEATILHEAVAHHGLRQLLGEHFDEFLDKVYEAADNGIKERIDLLASRNGWNRRVATEEYLAGLAEETDFTDRFTLWFSKVKQYFINMLGKAGFKNIRPGSIGDNELRYILWRSYQNLANPGRYRAFEWEAEDVAMQYKLQVGQYDTTSEKVESAADSGIRFRDGDFTPRDRKLAADVYEKMLSRGSWQFREATQDSMLGLKALYESILGKNLRIENVAGYENAYQYENRMSSANNGEQHQYFCRYMKPLLDSIHKLCGSKELDRRILTDYMMAKHGLERNEYMRNEAAANGEETERDFAGLCGLTGEDDWQVAETVVRQMVDDYESDHDTAELWDNVKKATNATLEKIYLSGLISEDTHNRVLGMYDFYIPLRGWDETTSDEVYGYLTSKDGPLMGSVFKKAEGRESKADDPIATIAMMADDAIRQGNRNIMKQRFLNFVHGNPSDLVSVNEMWLQHNDVTDEWEPVFADLQPDMTHAEVESEIAKFEAKMEALRTSEPDKYKKGRDARNIPYKVVRGNLNEHQVLVKRNGRTYVMTINGNPRAAQALNGLTNPNVETGGVIGNMLKLGEYVNRHLSAFYTTRNPDFVVSNFMRDMLYSNCMTWVKENPRYALRFHKNFGKVNPLTLRKLLSKWENDSLSDSNYLEKMFKEFMLNGGETGYTSVKDIDGHKRTIASELKKQGSTGRKAWSALCMQLDLLNRSAENCARFAAFLTSREMGRTLDRSIHDAKEVSVNFNKKGSGGKFVNATGQKLLGKIGSYLGGGGRIAFVFWNAGIQGMTNFGRAGKRNPGKAIGGAAALFTLGYVIPLLAQMLGGGDGDDDDKNAYYNLPEYVRRSNICFKAGEQWITIPLPIEYRAIYGMGELACGVVSGNERYSNSELTRQMASQISQVMPLDMLEGGGGISPFIPSAFKPMTEAYIMNKGWTGLPVYKDTPYNKNDPEWTKAYQSADQHLVAFTRWLNETSGGNDYKKGTIDINPAKLEYLLSGTFGGAVSTTGKLKKMGETALRTREFEWRNMLLANRVIKSGDERTANRKLQNEYFKYLTEYEETNRLRKKYENAADDGILGYAERADFLYNSPEYLRFEIFEEYKAEIDALSDGIKAETSPEVKEELQAELWRTKRELVDRLHMAGK